MPLSLTIYLQPSAPGWTHISHYCAELATFFAAHGVFIVSIIPQQACHGEKGESDKNSNKTQQLLQVPITCTKNISL